MALTDRMAAAIEPADRRALLPLLERPEAGNEPKTTQARSKKPALKEGFKAVEVDGLEPTTFCAQSDASVVLSHILQCETCRKMVEECITMGSGGMGPGHTDGHTGTPRLKVIGEE